jgi:hypothetical protein
VPNALSPSPVPGHRSSLPVSFLFVANVSAAFYGLQLIDVPLFLCVRRLTSLCVLVTEFLVLRKVSSRPVMASILLVMAGTILAGYESLSSYFIGYIYVMMNNILTALLYTWVSGWGRLWLKGQPPLLSLAHYPLWIVCVVDPALAVCTHSSGLVAD